MHFQAFVATVYLNWKKKSHTLMIHEALACWDDREPPKALKKSYPPASQDTRQTKPELHHTLGMSGLKLRQGAFSVTKDILGMWPFAEQKGEGSPSQHCCDGKVGTSPTECLSRYNGPRTQEFIQLIHS